MTAAPTEEPGGIPARSWPDGYGALVIAPTRPQASRQLISVRTPRETGTGESYAVVEFSSRELREMAAELLERADALDNVPGRHRRTPNWHLREGEKFLGTARHHLNHGMDPQLAMAQAAVASAHFQAAQAKRVHTFTPVTTHESGKDTE